MPTSLYEYRKLTEKERKKLAEERKARGFPPHQPPHLVLDLDPAAGLARGPGVTDEDRSSGDRIEREGLSFHETVHATYRIWAERHPERIKVLDASLDPDEVAEAALSEIRSLLAEKA